MAPFQQVRPTPTPTVTPSPNPNLNPNPNPSLHPNPNPKQARPAMPAFTGGLGNLSISSPGGAEPQSINSARAHRLVTLPQAMPSSWQRNELSVNPVSFQ